MGEEVVVRQVEAVTRGQAERLAPMIAEALSAAGLAPRDLAGIAACTGPGNFTGLRIAVAAARGLALGAGRASVGVPRLMALAADAAGAVGAPGPLAVSAAATRGRVHLQIFDARGAALDDIALLEVEAAVARARAAGARRAVGPLAEAAGLPGPAGDLVDPAQVARLGARVLAEAAARGEAPARPAPIYLRPPDAAPSSERPPPRLPTRLTDGA